MYLSLVGRCTANHLSYTDFLSMSMNEVTAFLEGIIASREQGLNDTLYANHVQAVLISQAVWGSADFPTTPMTVNLTNKVKVLSKEEQVKDILKFQLGLHKEMVELKGG